MSKRISFEDFLLMETKDDNLDDVKYHVVKLGVKVGDNMYFRVSQLKGLDVNKKEILLDDKAKAEETAKLYNKDMISSSERKSGMKYAVAVVKDGKYTGK